jgi:predicted nuclease of predicted toxin-antitoxin system
MKVLLDAMYDEWEKKLTDAGFEACSVKKLEKQESKLGHDFNVMNYAILRKMVLVTNDAKMGRTCEANNIPCVIVNLEKIFELIVIPILKGLEK